MSLSNGTLLLTCLLASTIGCATERKIERVFDVWDYCWTADHFAEVDFERAAFIQFVNDDLVIYRLSESDTLYCAYPVSNDAYKEQARRRGLPFAEYRSVIP